MKIMNSMKSEFNLKYSGTVMMVQLGNNRFLGKVEQAEDGWPFVYVNMYKQGKAKKNTKITSGSFNIDSLILTRWLPKEGYYNKIDLHKAPAEYPESYTPFFLKKSTNKHWANSYGVSSYIISNMTDIIPTHYKVHGILSSEVISSIYNPVYPTLNAAYNMIGLTKYIAVSDKVCLEQIGDKIIALYVGYPFGICVKDKKGEVVVRLIDKISAIKELFINQGIPCYYERTTI